jgi:hypothetical protein
MPANSGVALAWPAASVIANVAGPRHPLLQRRRGPHSLPVLGDRRRPQHWRLSYRAGLCLLMAGVDNWPDDVRIASYQAPLVRAEEPMKGQVNSGRGS